MLFLKHYLLLLCFLQTSFAYCQKFLQMDIDKFGGRISFSIGDELEFQVDGKREWFKFTINDFNFDKQEIIFDELSIPLSRITKIVHIKKGVRKTSLWLGSLFGGFGVPWTVYAIYGLIVGSPMVVPATFIVGAVALSLSAILLTVKIFWKRKYVISEKRRLRIVDLTIYPNKAFVPLQKGNIFAGVYKAKNPTVLTEGFFCSERETRTLDLSIMSAAL